MDIINDDDVTAARQSCRALAAEIGFGYTDQTMVAAVITELARNILDYAGRGEVLFHSIENGGRRDMVVIARDQGPGIANIKMAMQASYRVAGGLGLGLRGLWSAGRRSGLPRHIRPMWRPERPGCRP